MGRLKNYTLVAVSDQQREVIQSAYRALRDYTGETYACLKCHRATTRPSKVCSWCAQACRHPVSIEAYIIVRNGAMQPKSLCLECGGVGGVYRGSTLLDMAFEDRTSNESENRPCARCGAAVGTELHHWAPRAIFSDAEMWPQDHLCVDCHRLWHRAMRAAKGHRLDERRHVDGWSPSDFGGAA